MAAHRASCQCGSLTVETDADPEFIIACNCRACQKRSGSPFGAVAYFRKEAFHTSGPSKAWRRSADSGRWLENVFCPVCGSTVYWTLEMRPDHVGVAYGVFDTDVGEPMRVVWAEEQHPWVHFPDDWPSYQKGSPS